MASDSEQLVRKQGGQSFHSTFRQTERRNEASKEPEKRLKVDLEMNTEGPPFKLTTRSDFAAASIPYISKAVNHTETMKCDVEISEVEEKLIIAKNASLSLQKIVEQVLSDNFNVGFEEASTLYKSPSYYVIECVLTELAPRGSLHDIFEDNLER